MAVIVARVTTAWDLIGASGQFRIVGGRTIYEAVCWNEARARSSRPRLARLVTADGSLRQVNRYVDPDTQIEVLEED